VGYRAPLSPHLAHPIIIISFIINLMEKIKILKGEKNFKDDFANLILYTDKNFLIL